MFGLLIISSSISTYAQKNNVQNAYRAFEKKNMEEAIEYIELAAANSKTANDVKMQSIQMKIISH